jgi:plasmid stabilization system protein ParE
MSLPVVYLPQALDDIDAAYNDHERRSMGLGDRFLDALRDRVDLVRDNPDLRRASTVRLVPSRYVSEIVW